MQRKHRRLCALAVCIAMLPFAALAGGSGGVFEDMGRTYAAALALLEGAEAGGYARAAALFGEVSDYRDAPKYAAYCGAMAALEEGDWARAVSAFQALRDAGFLDSTAMYFYAQARRAEQEGELATAIRLLEGVDVLDSLTRLVELKIAFAQAEGAQREPLPINAREEGLAVVVIDWTDGLDLPAGLRKRSEFPLYELLLIDTFDYDSQGRPWDQTTLEEDSPFAVEALTDETPVFSDAKSIYHMSEEEESSFRAGIPLETARVKPAYGTVIGRNVNVRNTAGGRRGDASGMVTRGDSVELLGVSLDAEGKAWQEVRFTSDSGDTINGFIQEDKAVNLSEMPYAPLSQEMAEAPAPGDMPGAGQAEDAASAPAWQKLSAAHKTYWSIQASIEQGNYGEALEALPELREGLAAQAELAARLDVYPEDVRVPDEPSLRSYILGREAEEAGDAQGAAEHYWASGAGDSVQRRASLMPPETFEVALQHKVNDQLGYDVAEMLNELMEMVCEQPDCADRPIHTAWLCGHCAYLHTELCGEPPCPVCEGYMCNDFAHEKICSYCGAFDCTDSRGGAEHHGQGKCVKRKKTEPAPQASQEVRYQPSNWSPPGWFDRNQKKPCNCMPLHCMCNPCLGGC